jgi:protein-S-isoprenylcysteine O-methyltransferase Ste14
LQDESVGRASPGDNAARITPVRVIIGELRYTAFFGLLLFLPARTLAWPRAWVLLVVLAIIRSSAALGALRTNRDLLVERAKIPVHRDQSLADRILLPGVMASFAALVAFNPIDRFYLHLLGEPRRAVSYLGLVIFASGWALVAATLRSNAFATTVVRYQEERDQRVIDYGVYSVIRHPMYAGMVLVMIGMGLWLGSNAAAVASVIPIGILMIRIIHEERVLGTSLTGYDGYMRKVRARLIPFIW